MAGFSVWQGQGPMGYSRRNSCDSGRKVKQAGVVGAGGGGFPTHVKLAAKADTVIANGAECEPLLHKDAVVMEQQAAELVRGMQLAMEAVGAKAGVIGIKAKKKLAVEAVTAACKGTAAARPVARRLLPGRRRIRPGL